MDKLNLNLDDLNVDSFATEENRRNENGTVRGQGFTDPGNLSCDDQTCLDTCPDTCDATCGCGGGGGGDTEYDETACSICSPTNLWEPCDAY